MSPSAPARSFSEQENYSLSKRWWLRIFLPEYLPSSLLAGSNLDPMISSSAAQEDGFSTDRKRKTATIGRIPGTGAGTGMEDILADRGDDGNSDIYETGPGAQTEELSSLMVLDGNDDVDGDMESSEAGGDGANPKKKRRISKVEEATFSSVPEGNKRKRKKSSVAKEAEEELGPTSRTANATLPTGDLSLNIKSEGSSGTRNKRTVVKDATSLSSHPVAVNPRFAVLQRMVQRLILSQSFAHHTDIESSKKNGRTGCITLPPALEALLDFWARSLLFLECRLEEAAHWRESASELMTRANSKAGNMSGSRHVQTDRLGWDEKAKALLSEGDMRGIKVQGRDTLKSHLNRIRSWAATAVAFLGQHTTLPTINSQSLPGDPEDKQEGALTLLALSDFIRAGELLQVDRAIELTELRTELKKGKSWLARYNRIAPGAAVAAATLNKVVGEELDLLITEARTSLRVDVREELEAISQATRRYCLCRQLYHGSMVGCDECDEWYHFQCVGLTQFQVERADKYVCIRCSLKISFYSAANLAAQITNRWSAPDEALRAREGRRSRVRRINLLMFQLTAICLLLIVFESAFLYALVFFV